MGFSRLLAVISISSALFLQGCNNESSPIAHGTLEKTTIAVRSPGNETLMSLPIKEGQSVSAGDVLFTLDSELLDLQLEQAIANRDQVQAQLELLLAGTRPEQIGAAEARHQAAQANTRAARLDWQRVEELYAKKVTGKAELDASRAKLDAAKANENAARQSWLEARNGPTQAQIEQVKAAVMSAESAINLALAQRAKFTVHAPVSGTIETLPWHVGDDVTANVVITQITPTDANIYARLYLPVDTITKLRAGHVVQVRVDGFDAPFDGRIRHINQTPAFTPYYAMNADERARLMYLAEIDIVTEQNLPAGLGVEMVLP